MDDVRILKGWTKDEREELEEAKDGVYYCSAMIIWSIASTEEGDFGVNHITHKFECSNSVDEQNQLIKDIADFYVGKAKFPEQKYYIKMPKVNYPYLIRDMGGKFDHAQSPDILGSGENSFTEQEIKDIDPRYMAFAVPVEDDNE